MLFVLLTFTLPGPDWTEQTPVLLVFVSKRLLWKMPSAAIGGLINRKYSGCTLPKVISYVELSWTLNCPIKSFYCLLFEWKKTQIILKWVRTWAERRSPPQRSLAWEHLCQVWSWGFPQHNRCPAGWLLSGWLLWADKHHREEERTHSL